MKKILVVVVVFLIVFLTGCVGDNEKTKTPDPIPTTDLTTVPTSSPTIIQTTTITQTTIAPTSSSAIRENISFPDFKRSDQIKGNWSLEARDSWSIYQINNDSKHSFSLTIRPKYDEGDYHITYLSGVIIPTSTDTFQMILRWDPSKTGTQNDAMQDLAQFIWHYDSKTGDLVADTGDRLKYHEEINLKDFEPIYIPRTTPIEYRYYLTESPRY
ncbi:MULTISPECIES: hypothetical protein [unclassified Methanoregula]|uniref:hypothetical protein n=1 Tax=unclassified Methanoregula TaxID=2649730 RepID=UPI0009C4E7DF|nr:MULTISPECIES: hypothetical protein [unclassified Methanoregula]OPX63903.1 MAG: hypothetical protein A4E33_01433 [Methanoregula sp. PtaB.Bin085]OPY35456.1 MAG: hypothetical protein A4E34_00731 [Methanoregula sp. PtaU1.Bin006]